MACVFGFNLPGKYTDAEKNESTSFLPGDAESTKALEAVEELQGGEQAPTVVVYRREGGLTAADARTIAEDQRNFNRCARRRPRPARRRSRPDAALRARAVARTARRRC